jgi:hypothetical protein
MLRGSIGPKLLENQPVRAEPGCRPAVSIQAGSRVP